MSRFEKKSYSQIKEACDFLNASCKLDLGERPNYDLFFPLLNSGVIDHIGKNYYALTRPVIIEYKSHAYLLNGPNYVFSDPNLPVGWQLITHSVFPEGIDIIGVNSLSVLKSFPSIDKVVDTWHSSLQDESELSYHDFRNNVGVAECKKGGHTLYFSIPQRQYQKELPDHSINPDAYQIGICFERIVNGQGNGTYDKNSHILKVPKFAFPIMLYRVLSLDGLSYRSFPYQQGDYIIFEHIEYQVIKELNRILCKSIKYE
jgi:hypothetical protein